MPGPNKSKLNAHKNQIAELRRTRPPTSYADIARILKEQHGVVINPSSIWSFVKVRSASGGRKVKYAIVDDDSSKPPIQQPLPPDLEDDIYDQALDAQRDKQQKPDAPKFKITKPIDL